MTRSERFWSKVRQDGDCWVWAGAKSWGGYGRFNLGPRASGLVQAHRWAYEAMVADIPNGLHLDHLCRNRACVNPYHLQPVTQQVNISRGDMARANRERMSGATHCKRGHPFDAANTRIDKNGFRACKACHRTAVNERKRRVRAQGVAVRNG